jgi:hypothetical protein
MKEERNKLQEFVFPRLRELAIAENCHFQAIDLRWGVSKEASLDQQAMKICLTEIERSQYISPRPNFIMLLGDRFGWRPLPYSIPVSEMERMLDFMTAEERKLTLWNENTEENDVSMAWNNGKPLGKRGWYRMDDNAEPPQYVLQPRLANTGFEDAEIWETEVERPLLTILERAAKQAAFNEDELVKYTLSATGQEILHGAMNVEDAQSHVFGFFRTIINPEKLSGMPEENIYFESKSIYRTEQLKLKEKVKKHLGDNIQEFQVEWNVKVFLTDHIGSIPDNLNDCLKLNSIGNTPQNLCEAVWLRLSQVILTETEKLKPVDMFEKEQEAHSEFCQDREKFFVGREDTLSCIADYLESSDSHLLVVWGQSGSGKSSLMAKAIQKAQINNKTAVSIFRFIGATPESSNRRKLLESLCRQLTQVYNGDKNTIPIDYPDLLQEIPKRMELAGSQKQILIFLDALDQLEEIDQTFISGFFLRELPPNVKMIISFLPGELVNVLKKQLPSISILEVKGMSRMEGSELLHKWLANSKRHLTIKQSGDILTKFEKNGGLPLYLKLSFDDAKNWHSYDELPTRSKDIPGLNNNIPGIIQDLFWRLQQETQHGKILVERVLGYLAAARNGLTEDELIDLIWEKDKEMQSDFMRRSPKSPEVNQLPVIVWSRLYMDLEPYLSERKEGDAIVLTFYHSQVYDAAIKYFLQDEAKQARHYALAVNFENICKSKDNKYLPIKRAISEFAYHYRQCKDAKKLQDIYSNMSYLCNYVRCLNAFDLKKEVSLVPEQCIDNEIRCFINNSAFILAKFPEQAPQLLYKETENPFVKKQAELLAVPPWIRADCIHIENNSEEMPMSFIPVLSKEMPNQANCVAQNGNIAFVHNLADKVELLSTDDLRHAGEILLQIEATATIKKLLCDSMGKLLALVYDDGCIEVVRIVYSKKGSILHTKSIHREKCMSGKFGAVSAYSSFDGIIFQNVGNQVVSLKIDDMGEVLISHQSPENKLLANYFGNSMNCFVWKDNNEYLIDMPGLDIQIRTAYKVLAVCRFEERFIVSTEESKLFVYQSSNCEMERAIPNRLPIISICLTNRDLLLMTDRHGNILSLDSKLNLIEHGRCSQDLYDDYPSSVNFTANSGIFFVSNRRCVTLAPNNSSIGNIICVGGEKEHLDILKYSRTDGFELSIGGRAFIQLKQDIISHQYEFEYSNFKVAWSPGGTVAYTKRTQVVTLEDNLQSKNYDTGSEIVKILYYEHLNKFLILCRSGELYFVGSNDAYIEPFKVPISNTGNYLMDICGVYVCVISKNVMCSYLSLNKYTETILSLLYPYQREHLPKLDVICFGHIGNNEPNISSISYNKEVNSLYLYREGFLERWSLNNPKERETSRISIRGDRNRLLPYCGFKDGGFFVSLDNKIKFQSMQFTEPTMELPAFRTITSLAQNMGEYGYFVENNQKVYSFNIKED